MEFAGGKRIPQGICRSFRSPEAQRGGVVKYYPIYLNLKDRTVLLVGAGEVARQKIPALLASGARIRLVAPEAHKDVAALTRENKIEWVQRFYETRDLKGIALVIAATDDPILQKRIAAEARKRRI